MKIDGVHHRTIWVADDGWSVEIFDQTRLPHELTVARLATLEDAANAISDMQVRGAPLIGATAAYGICLALRDDPSDAAVDRAYDRLLATRPTAVNLRWALDEMRAALTTSRTRIASSPPTLALPKSATTMSISAPQSAGTGWRSYVDWRGRNRRAIRSTY